MYKLVTFTRSHIIGSYSKYFACICGCNHILSFINIVNCDDNLNNIELALNLMYVSFGHNIFYKISYTLCQYLTSTVKYHWAMALSMLKLLFVCLFIYLYCFSCL